MPIRRNFNYLDNEFTEFCRFLRSGGRFVVERPNTDRPRHLAQVKRGRLYADWLEFKGYGTPYEPQLEGQTCLCGHSYHRHYDPYENYFPVGCKYCDCRVFQWPGLESDPVLSDAGVPTHSFNQSHAVAYANIAETRLDPTGEQSGESGLAQLCNPDIV